MIILRQKEFVSVRNAKKIVDSLSTMGRSSAGAGRVINSMNRQGLISGTTASGKLIASGKPLPANAANRLGGKVQTVRNNIKGLAPRNIKPAATNAFQTGGWGEFVRRV